MSLPVIVDESFTPNWVINQSNSEYHSDKTAVSSSSLKEILHSPKAFHASHTGKYKREENDAFRIGTAIHMAILEPELFKTSHTVMPKFGGAGSVKAREEWKASLSPDVIILKEEELSDLSEMVSNVQNHRDAFHLLKNGQTEVSGYFRDTPTGIKCRIRPDFWSEQSKVLLDVKSTRVIDKESFRKTIHSYKYHFQLAYYQMGIEQITGKKIEKSYFLAVQKVAPFEVALYECDEEMMSKGAALVRTALDKLHVCLDWDDWHSYQTSSEKISLPEWIS